MRNAKCEMQKPAHKKKQQITILSLAHHKANVKAQAFALQNCGQAILHIPNSTTTAITISKRKKQMTMRKSSIIRAKKAQGNFTPINNYIAAYLQDMSAAAFGLYCNILSLPENWHFSIKGFAAISADGRDKIKNTLDELRRMNLIARKCERGAHGRFEFYKYTVTQFSEQELDALKRKYKGRTLVSNNIFKDSTLSNREKGLMVYMLMTSRTGKLTIDTIAANFTDGRKSIATGLKVLEDHGYIQRYKLREGGRFAGITYIVNELPCAPNDKTEEVAYISEEKHEFSPKTNDLNASSPCAPNPYTVESGEGTNCASPCTPKPSEESLNNKENNKLTLSTGYLSIQLDSATNSKKPANDLDGLSKQEEKEISQPTHQQPVANTDQHDLTDIEHLSALTAMVREQVHLDDLTFMYPDQARELTALANLMVEIIHSSRTYGRSLSYRINGANIPAQAVAFRFRELDSDQFAYVASTLSELSVKIRNPRAYMISTLYNAPTTYQFYMDSCVNADLYGEEAQEYRDQQERNAEIRRNSEQLSRLLAMTDELDAS